MAEKCVAPGCADDSAVSFFAAETGRLAGRDWIPGDTIPLCFPHAADIWRTAGVTDPDQVADWLRPSAADPPNTWNPGRAYARCDRS